MWRKWHRPNSQKHYANRVHSVGNARMPLNKAFLFWLFLFEHCGSKCLCAPCALTLCYCVCLRVCERETPLIYEPRWSSGTKQMSVQSSNLNAAYLFKNISFSTLWGYCQCSEAECRLSSYFAKPVFSHFTYALMSRVGTSARKRKDSLILGQKMRRRKCGRWLDELLVCDILAVQSDLFLPVSTSGAVLCSNGGKSSWMTETEVSSLISIS